jgi:hypothetical protein
MFACSICGCHSGTTVWRLLCTILCPPVVWRSNWTRPIPSLLDGPKQEDEICN